MNLHAQLQAQAEMLKFRRIAAEITNSLVEQFSDQDASNLRPMLETTFTMVVSQQGIERAETFRDDMVRAVKAYREGDRETANAATSQYGFTLEALEAMMP